MFDFCKEKQEIKLELFDQHFSISQQDVEKAFFCTKVNKTQGPDNTCGRLLKTCAKELSPVFYSIFTRSLEVQQVPRMWKNALVVPVPKSSHSTTLNKTVNLFEKHVCLEIWKNTESDQESRQIVICLQTQKSSEGCHSHSAQFAF